MKTLEAENATFKFTHLLQLEILVNMKFLKVNSVAQLARKKREILMF